eukprot:589536-Pyramimonas_sp.AAC.2
MALSCVTGCLLGSTATLQAPTTPTHNFPMNISGTYKVKTLVVRAVSRHSTSIGSRYLFTRPPCKISNAKVSQPLSCSPPALIARNLVSVFDWSRG